MAKPGPPKKPSALEDLQGRPSHRPKNEAEPKPAAVVSLVAPAWLDRPARDVWNSLAPELHRLGLLTIIDAAVLAGACRWWAIYRAADAVLKRRARSPRLGFTDETKANGRQAIPEIGIAQKAWKEATDAFAKFGVFPSERVGLNPPQPKGLDDGARSGKAAPKKSEDPHDQLAERRRVRALTRGQAG